MAITPAKQSKLRRALKNEYVKDAILIMILIGGLLSFWFGIRAVFRTEYPFMAVASGSMEPTLPVGTLIVVQGYANSSTIYAVPPKWDENHTRVLEGGDIVVFWHWSSGRGLEHWVHRAVGDFTQYGKRYLRTQGDNEKTNPGSDTHRNITAPYDVLPGLPEEYVIGKVVANAPVIGQIALFVHDNPVIIVVLIVVVLIVEFIPFSRKKDQEQEPVQESGQEQVEA